MTERSEARQVSLATTADNDVFVAVCLFLVCLLLLFWFYLLLTTRDTTDFSCNDSREG